LHADEIRSVFSKYGVNTDLTVNEHYGACASRPTISVYDGNHQRISPFVLRDRLESLHAAKSRVGEGPYHEMLFGNLVQLATLSAVLAVVVIVSALPRSFWSRRFAHHLEEASLPQFTLPQPHWLRRLDQKLVTRYPRFWATRMPTFLFDALV